MKFLAQLIAAVLISSLGATAQTTLKNAYKDRFHVGAALNESWFDGQTAAQPGLVQTQFDSISPENVLKWAATEPMPGQFQFGASDRYVDFGQRNGMYIVGHTLVWHSQIPDWVFQDGKGGPVDRDTLLARMKSHIDSVVGHYKGRIQAWDVVNEILAEDGSLRDTPWRKIIGDDYVLKAFEYAHAADPAAELYYNDYGIETGKKHAGALALLKQLRDQGVPIAGVGMQEHVNLHWPMISEIDQAITDFGNLGLKVAITELDVDVLPSRNKSMSADVNREEAADPSLNPYAAGLPDDMQQTLAHRYADLFGVYLKHRDIVSRVTVWGVTDHDSWLNNWPIHGRTSYPLLFDRMGNPKPAFDAVVAQAKALPVDNNLKTSATAANQ